MLFDPDCRSARRWNTVMPNRKVNLRLLGSTRRDLLVVLKFGNQLVDIHRRDHIGETALAVYPGLILPGPQQRASGRRILCLNHVVRL
jgi:hypothetical protein